MAEIANDRGYDWDAQRADLISRCDEQDREALKASAALEDALAAVDSSRVRDLIATALGSKTTSPFDLKGGRQARIFAMAIVEVEGVPEKFASAFEQLHQWIVDGCSPGTELTMWGDDASGS